MNEFDAPKEKIALVVQGGSLKSIFTSGVFDAFLANNYNPFDIMIGVSGGAMTMSYYIAEQYRSTYSILSKLFTDDKFISLKQIFATEGYVNLDYLQRYSLREFPLDFEHLMECQVNKHIEVVTTNMEDGEPFYICPQQKNWMRALRASATLPFLTKGYCLWEKETKLMDGGWSDPIPVKRAVDLGATKIVVLRTMPADTRLEWSYFGWFGSFWHRDNPGLSQRFSNDHQYYNDTLDYMESPPEGVEIIQIAPPELLATTSYSTSKSKMDADYRLGLDLGLQFLMTQKDELVK